MRLTFRRKTPVTRTFTAGPGSWLWAAGAPVWQISTLGAAVALTSFAVPALPTVLPDRTPATPSSTAAPARTDDQGRGDPDDTGQGSAVASTTVETTSDPGRTSTPATASIGSTGPAPTRTTDPTASTTTAPVPTDPGTAPTTDPQVASTFTGVTIDAADEQNERYLVSSVTCSSCVSGSRVIGVGLLATLSIEVDAESAGTRTLAIAYESLLDRTLVVTVNDGEGQSITATGTGSLTEPAWTSLTVDLQQGENTIEFGNPMGLAPNLDQFVVS